jgi:hypothetical protein
VVAEESADAEWIRRSHRHDEVGFSQRCRCRRVSTGADHGVCRLVVGVDGRADIDDGVVGPAAARRQHGMQPLRGQLRPAVRPVEAGEHLDVGSASRHPGRETLQFCGVEAPLLGAAAGSGDSGAVVAETEEQCERRGDGVGVDERRAPTGPRQLDSELDRDG